MPHLRTSHPARVVFGLGLALFLISQPRADAQTTALFFDSQPGDYIGLGARQTYGPGDGTFTVQRDSQDAIRVSVTGPSYSFWWSLEFAASGRAILTTGTYENARRYPFTPFVGLAVGGSGRGCNTLMGRFVVLEIEYAGDGSVARFAADFEQHCEGGDPALFGAVRYNSTISTLVPFDGAYPVYRLSISSPSHGVVSGGAIACGGSGTSCTTQLASPEHITLNAQPDPGYLFGGWTGACSGSRTVSVNVNMYKECAAEFVPYPSAVPLTIAMWTSDSGDWVGAGKAKIYTPENTNWRITSLDQGNGVEISLDGVDDVSDTWWRVDFKAPQGAVLNVGTYTNAMRAPFRTSTPGLEVSGDGRGCNELSGSFEILDLVINAAGNVSRFAADFVQHCEGNVPALVGSVRYESTVAPTLSLSVHRSGDGQVTSMPDGISCGASCSATYPSTSSVELAAAPAPLWTFGGFAGDADCADGDISIVAPTICEVTFIGPHALTISESGNGRVVSNPAGIDCTSNGFGCTAQYAEGVTVMLTATPATGWTFGGWAGDPDCADGTVHMTASRNCTAVFIPPQNLSLVVTGHGNVTSTPAGIDCGGPAAECLASYPFGTVVVLTAAPMEGWAFAGWRGNDDCSDGVVTMNSTTSCNAVFQQTYCVYTVSPVGVSFSQAAGASIISVAANRSDCEWTARSSANWITLNTTAYAGSASVPYSVTRNLSHTSRTATLTIAGVTVNIAQQPYSCVQNLNTLFASFAAAGGSGSADVTAECQWSATTDATWITIDTSAWDYGTFALHYRVAPKASRGDRSATIDFGSGLKLTITQTGTAAQSSAPKWDFDRDGNADVTVWRPGDGVWYIRHSGDGNRTYRAYEWGNELSDRPLTGDFDGDGRPDPTVWRPASGTWYVLLSSTEYTRGFARQWGDVTAGDVPVPGDYDGDGATDMAVWRPAFGNWYILKSSDNYRSFMVVQWGTSNLLDEPVPADYDGDGTTDIAVWRPGVGVWFVLTSSSGFTSSWSAQWGSSALGDVPVPDDYDGDGRADLMVWRPGPGMWFLLTSSSHYTASHAFQWGSGDLGDEPLSADYDGDGRADFGVWRPASGVWFIRKSSTGYQEWSAVQWGLGSLRDRILH